jgi:hypothetical protein
MYLWIGANVDPSVIQNLFGVSNMQQLNVEKVDNLVFITSSNVKI